MRHQRSYNVILKIVFSNIPRTKTHTFLFIGTMTGEAIKFLVEKFYTRENGARLDNPHVLRLAIVITDGRSQDRTVNIHQKTAKVHGE